MYRLLQGWVLLTIHFALGGAIADRPTWRRLALVCYLAATLTQFVSVTLLAPLVLGMGMVGWLQARRWREKPWFMRGHAWLEGMGWVVVLVIALILGIFTGIVAFFGSFMNLSYLLAGSVSINPILFTIAILLLLAWKTADWWGLDRWVLPTLGTPWSPGLIFQEHGGGDRRMVLRSGQAVSLPNL